MTSERAPDGAAGSDSPDRSWLRALQSLFVAVALVVTLGLGIGVNAIGLEPPIRAAVEAEEHAHGPLQIVSSVLLGLLTLWVLFREGPRSFLAQLWPEGSEGREGRAHGHAH